MRLILFTVLTLMIPAAYADYKVAVIDTGLSGFFATKKTMQSKCKSGHYDFLAGEPNVGFDTIGHGSFVANLIMENIRRDDVCLLVYKVNAYVDPQTRNQIGKAVMKAYREGAKAINISMGESNFSHFERKAIRYVTRRGVKVFVAAGNEGAKLNEGCKIYPACYRNIKNLYTVGADDKSGLTEAYSNRGLKVQIYEYGTIPLVGRGTSFASPRATAKYLRELK